MASVHGEAHTPSGDSDGGTQGNTSFRGKKRKRDEAEAEDEAEAGAGGNSADMMMIDMTTDTTTTSGAQTPASSVDADILLKIDPRLLNTDR